MPTRKIFRDSDSEPEVEENAADRHSDVEDEDDDDTNSSAKSAESDDDAEPEAIAFKDSKQNVLDRVRFALRQIERDRQQTKTKRRNRDALYKEQKKQKLARLETCRLPDDVLEELGGTDSTVPPMPAKPISTLSADIPVDTGADSTPDYIPLDSNVKAVSSKELRQIATTAQSALRFRNKQLYGRRVHRERASAILSRRAKKAAAGRT